MIFAKRLQDYHAMKGGNPDKFRGSAFPLSLLFRHFPDNIQKIFLFVGFLTPKVYICILKNNYKNF